jgi:hypothetical protein
VSKLKQKKNVLEGDTIIRKANIKKKTLSYYLGKNKNGTSPTLYTTNATSKQKSNIINAITNIMILLPLKNKIIRLDFSYF